MSASASEAEAASDLDARARDPQRVRHILFDRLLHLLPAPKHIRKKRKEKRKKGKKACPPGPARARTPEQTAAR
eukprot:2761076-Rhodomonas_salina.1